MKAFFFARFVNPRLKSSFFDKKTIIQKILLPDFLDSPLHHQTSKTTFK
jgi:hypothetical protein